MQQKILANKKLLTILSFLLIISGLIIHHVLSNQQIGAVLLLIASLIGGAPIAIQAFQALKLKIVGIDVLVTIAILGALLIQNFEESAIVAFLFLFGAYLEQRTLQHTRTAIQELTQMAPEQADMLMPDGQFVKVAIDEVDVAAILKVNTGGKIPVDGSVIEGDGYVDESTITGEAKPQHKSLGAPVFAGTILSNGSIKIKAEKVGEDTTFGKIIELIEEAQDSKSEAERYIDRFAKYYTPIVLLLALLVGVWTKNIETAMTVLVLGCPGALVIGVPVSNVAGIGNGAKNGILLKGSEVIQTFSQVDTMVFDKTGTLTTGEQSIATKKYYELDEQTVQSILASVESHSDHPLAKTILKELTNVPILPVTNLQVIKGQGMQAQVNQYFVSVGNLALMKANNVTLTTEQATHIEHLMTQGHSLVLMAVNAQLVYLTSIQDQVRPNVKNTLQQLKQLGIKNLIVLSGDNQGTVDTLAKELPLNQAIGNLLPANKADYIKQLQQQGAKVAFIGDGINDSPSLALADIGIAMGGGTDVAIETSDVVLVQNQLHKLLHVVGLTSKTVRNMRQNIAIALLVVAVLLISLLIGDWMTMTIGMFVHEASILVVIFNAMRLLKYKNRKV